jgi:hypothetical protein
MQSESTGRRSALKALAGGVLAVGAVGTASRLAGSSDDSGSRRAGLPALELSSHSDSDVRSLDLRLGDDLLPRLSANRWRSPRLPTSTHSMVAFTWQTTVREPHIHISSRVDGVWQPWSRMHLLHDLPDQDSGEDRGVAGTELVWIGDSDGIQVRVAGGRPRDLTLVLLHPARRPSDAPAITRRGPVGSLDVRRAGTSQPVPQPDMFSRQDWGADESWRDGAPRYNSTIQQVHVHHTVNSNDYSKTDVPALIRGMYRYHTSNLGWSDIGYNFLVDRFGRIWVGRAGGRSRPVRGAHTLGFNATSTGISVIGNYDLVAPTSATLHAIARVAAWKLARYGRHPKGGTNVVSEGSDKFRSGRIVRLPVIDGHRDTNDTACPGQMLYDELPRIRRRTKAIMDRSQGAPITITRASTLTGSPVLGKRLTVAPGVFAPPDATLAYTWMRNGADIAGAGSASYTTVADDLGTQLTVRVDVSKAGYRSIAELLTVSGLVKAETVVAARAVGRLSKAAVHVTVTAVGMNALLDGEVAVRMNRRTKIVDLTHGKATARFFRFPPGQYPVDVTYSGSAATLPAKAVTTVTVG